MRVDDLVKRTAAFALGLSMIALSGVCLPAVARHHRSSSATNSPSSSKTQRSSKHQTRHHRKSSHGSRTAVKPRYAYPLDMYMMEEPPQDLSLLPADEALKIRYAFQSGTASNYPPNMLIRSGAVNYYPIHGGILNRREEVKYIIMHSTETGVPQDARHVINSWSSGGRRHPAAQFIVDRDGTIFETVDPKYATVHINIFKTLPGIDNENTIGIEMVHCGGQSYTPEQKASVIRLVTYLQDRYHVLDEHIYTHRYVQQGDHTDPVAFDWDGFIASKDDFHGRALAMVHEAPVEETLSIDADVPVASVYLEIHPALKQALADTRHVASIQELQKQLGDAQNAQITTSSADPRVFAPLPATSAVSKTTPAAPVKNGGCAPGAEMIHPSPSAYVERIHFPATGSPSTAQPADKPQLRGAIELPPSDATMSGDTP